MDTNNAILTARDLTIGYPSKKGPARSIATTLNLALQPGQLVCLLGPNGSGKSTLLRTLAGMQPPLSGTLTLASQNLAQLTPKEKARQISIVLTDAPSLGLMQVSSLVALGRHPHTHWSGCLSDHDRQRIHWALTAVGAENLSERNLGELSDGERQKAMIARALAQEAPLMLLDEPTAFLDLPRRVELLRILRDLAHRENLAILLSTHDLDLALRSADQLWLLNAQGHLTQGPPEALALEGEIASAFTNDKLDWDPTQGTFRLHRTPQKTAHLHGDGPRRLWTHRLLTRLGYAIDNQKQNPDIKIQIQNQTYTLTQNQSQQTLPTLTSLTDHLYNNPK